MTDKKEPEYIGPTPEKKYQGDDVRYAIDLPDPRDPEAEWVNIDYFPSKAAAIAFAKEHYGADEEGNINLLTCMAGKEEDEDDTEEDQTKKEG